MEAVEEACGSTEFHVADGADFYRFGKMGESSDRKDREAHAREFRRSPANFRVQIPRYH